MAYTVKSTNLPTVKRDAVADTTTFTQGFVLWVNGYPKTSVGFEIEVVVTSSNSKTDTQKEAEIDAAITAFISANFPA